MNELVKQLVTTVMDDLYEQNKEFEEMRKRNEEFNQEVKSSIKEKRKRFDGKKRKREKDFKIFNR